MLDRLISQLVTDVLRRTGRGPSPWAPLPGYRLARCQPNLADEIPQR
jgi:hypothetical protein